MPTRSIKLKLSLGSPHDGDQENIRIRRAVWSTHRLFNEGVGYYMKWMLMLRQQPLDQESLSIMAPEDRNVFSDSAQLKSSLLKAAREAQQRNAFQGVPVSDQDILSQLRKLYEELNPSSIGQSGDANQISRNYQSILVDPDAVGGLGESTGGRKPAWLAMPDSPEKEKKRLEWEARRASLNDAPRRWLKDAGVLPLFPAFNRTKPSWLRAPGEKQSAILTKGDRDMFQQALERLMSWESWNARVQKEWQVKSARQALLVQQYLTPVPHWHQQLREYERDREARLGRDAFRPEQPYRLGERTIRGWEALREKWLHVKPSDRSLQKLREILANEQTEKRGRLGDASDFFPWLAAPAQHSLWDREDFVRVHVQLNEAERLLHEAKLHARYTAPHPLDHPLWARSGHSGDSNIHKYVITEADGKLSVKLRLQAEEIPGHIVERDEVIPIRDSSQWNLGKRSMVPPLRIVAFDDLPELYRRAEAKNARECTWVAYVDPGTGATYHGTLGGARLQLDRGDFRSNGSSSQRLAYEEKLAQGGRFPRVYLNLTLSLPDPTEGEAHRCFKRVRPQETAPRTAVDYQLAAEKKKGAIELVQPGGASLTEGLRVMSVDLGIRQLAACSVFELVRASEANGTSRKFRIPVAGADGLFMEHRRSFLLELPGETLSPDIEKKRIQLRESRLLVRSCIRQLSRLLSLGRIIDPIKKLEELKSLLGQDSPTPADPMREAVNRILPPELLHGLHAMADKPSDPRWPEEVLKIHRQWEHALGKHIAKWRRQSRQAGRTGVVRGYGGLSFWHIEELEEFRKTLNSWSCHARNYERNPDHTYRTRHDGTLIPETARARRQWARANDADKGRDIDARLLQHINNLKEDRLKQAADQIVMAALGYQFQGPQHGWCQNFPPCQMVLFEDLIRYRFKTDRPRRENSMLMKWAHRELPRTVAMQGEVHGLIIGNTAAEFSSKYRASFPAIAPGIRCIKVTPADLARPWFIQACQRDIHQGRLKAMPKIGDFIPWDLGEWFATLDTLGRISITHADLNAAQNLMRRFWRRHSDIFRLKCSRSKDGSCYLPHQLKDKKRLQAALKIAFGSEAVRLIPIDPADEDEGYWLEPISIKDYRKLANSSPATTAADDESPNHDSDEGIDVAEELLAESRGEVKILFADPSGNVVPHHPASRSPRWLPAKLFWGRVRSAIQSRLNAANVHWDEDINPDGSPPDDDLPM